MTSTSRLTSSTSIASLLLIGLLAACASSREKKDAAEQPGPDSSINGSGGTGSGGSVGSGGAGTGGSAADAPGSGGVVSAGGSIAVDASSLGGIMSFVDGGLGTGGASGGSTGSCGDPGVACCAGSTCKDGGCCVSGICMAQGGSCVGLGGGICSAGSCGTCGGPGQTCCGSEPVNGTCTAPGTRCKSGACAKCGDIGLDCCPSGAGAAGSCLVAGSICGAANLCVPCGVPGGPCCPGSKCDGNACCYNNTCLAEATACGTNAGTCQGGRCSGCGSVTQPCCSSASCYDGLLCKSGACIACGNAGEACCPASSAAGLCKTGFACTGAGGDAICSRCGGLGDVCCAGSACNEGCCSGGRCVAGSCSVDAGNQPDVPAAPIDLCTKGGAPCTALPRFTGPQVLDGKDTEFCSIPSFELGFTNLPANARIKEYNGQGGSYLERVTARVAWDETGLHAFVRVYDPTFKVAPSATLWNGDSVELMFSSSTNVTGLTSVDTNTLHVIASPPYVQVSKDTSTSGSQSDLPTTQFVAGTDATGYWVELNLPWPGTAPTAATQIKFEMQLNVSDGISRSGDTQTRDAQVILYQGATPASTTCSSTDVSPFCDDRLWCTTTLKE